MIQPQLRSQLQPMYIATVRQMRCRCVSKKNDGTQMKIHLPIQSSFPKNLQPYYPFLITCSLILKIASFAASPSRLTARSRKRRRRSKIVRAPVQIVVTESGGGSNKKFWKWVNGQIPAVKRLLHCRTKRRKRRVKMDPIKLRKLFTRRAGRKSGRSGRLIRERHRGDNWITFSM